MTIINKPLASITVLITRPEEFAKSLAEKILALGGEPVIAPVIELVESAQIKNAAILFRQLTHYEAVVFISKNAVKYASPLIKMPWPSQVKVLSVGAVTADILKKKQIPVTYFPEVEWNTEKLLEWPGWDKLTNKSVLVVCGEAGRELLVTTLRDRGFAIDEAIVYERRMPAYFNSDELLRQTIDVMICSSFFSLTNLFQLMGEKNREWLLQKKLLVISERMADLAREMGYKNTLLIAKNPTDDEIIRTLIDWQENIINGIK